ncbi:Protoporphyrinogen oxidase [Panus rudis PR-1116 ss-1]|nr:Protoporphyrinogen oxidase [Panus rudis PR-1116 ss-1]
MSLKGVTILGGGLSGLSSAFHLTRRFPSVPLLLIERSSRLGGWVRSERVMVQDSRGTQARILIEAGPRTLRPNGKSVLELINLMNLDGLLITVPKYAPAARNRFLHVPGELLLTPLPNSLSSVITSPLNTLLLRAVLGEVLRVNHSRHSVAMKEVEEHGDMSVDSFLSLHFGPQFARILGSALVHGIYASDSRIVSMRAAFPSIFNLAGERGTNSIMIGVVKELLGFGKTQSSPAARQPYELGDIEERMRNTSVYSFTDGLETLTRAMENHLTKMDNVTIVKGEGVTGVCKDKAGNFVVTTPRQQYTSSHIVSSLPPRVLHGILSQSQNSAGSIGDAPPSLPHLTSAPSSSVTVVNVIFPPLDGWSIHPDGFGYLVPRREDAPLANYGENFENVPLEDRLLGVVFDSSALGEQDIYPDAENKTGRFTKLTLMFRGTAARAITSEDVIALLSNHLRPPRPLPQPVYLRTHLHTNCIPIPGVGHLGGVQALREALKGEYWDNRFAVIGAGVGGVSVPDCIEQGRNVGETWE